MSAANFGDVEFVVRTMAQTAVDNEKYFGDLDAVVGDGDFGYSMSRGFEKVIENWDTFDRTDIGTFLKKVAIVITSRIGGTSGPIWGTAFLRAGTTAGDSNELSREDVVAMLRRELVGQFPFFFSYTVLLPVRDAILYLLPQSSNRYSTVFWWGDAAAIVLALSIVFEISWHFMRSYPFLRLFLRVLWISAVVAFAVALTMLLWTKGPVGTDLALEWIILTERSARFLQVCLLIVAIALMSRLGLTWQNYSVGIAAGFGVYAALDLALLELRAHLHAVTVTAFVLMRSAAYNLGVAIWAFYFLRPQGGKPVGSLPGTDLANWNNALTEHVNKWYRH